MGTTAVSSCDDPRMGRRTRASFRLLPQFRIVGPAAEHCYRPFGIVGVVTSVHPSLVDLKLYSSPRRDPGPSSRPRLLSGWAQRRIILWGRPLGKISTLMNVRSVPGHVGERLEWWLVVYIAMVSSA